MLLINLPTDILNLLPGYLESLDDLHSLILTSRELYATTSNPTPSVVYSLATSPHTGIQPYPHLFIAIKARTLADWAVQSSENRERLFDAINTGGPSGVLDLALSVSPLTLNDLTFLRHTRTSILEPAIEYLEERCGPSDDIDSHLTVCHNITLLLINYWIYCDLFYHNITAPVLRRAAGLPPLEPLSNQTRLKWVRHFLPDHNVDALVEGRHDMIEMNILLNEGLESTFRKFLILPSLRHDMELRRNRFFKSTSHTGLASVQLIHMAYIKDDLTPEQTKSLWPEEIKELASAFGALDENQLSELYGPLPWDREGNFIHLEEADGWMGLQSDLYRLLNWD